MSPALRRVVAAMLVGYLVAVAMIVFWPTSEVPSSSVSWMHARLEALGAPAWISASMVEFVSNIVLFVPLSLLGSLLWPRWSWLSWTCVGLAATLVIEVGQRLQLPDRSATVRDVVANTLGALIGALLVLLVRSRTGSRAR